MVGHILCRSITRDARMKRLVRKIDMGRSKQIVFLVCEIVTAIAIIAIAYIKFF